MKEQIKDENSNRFYQELKPCMEEFCKQVRTLGVIDNDLQNDGKGRKLSLLKDVSKVHVYYGDVYSTKYKATFAYLAQAQRHRTLSYNADFLEKSEYYVPKIIRNDFDLVKEWKNDCHAQEKIIPQGTLLQICEMGSLDNFILKMFERKCSFAQLEINEITDEILHEYVNELEKNQHYRFEELKSYTKGSRCTFDNYKCSSPCKFAPGMKGDREI